MAPNLTVTEWLMLPFRIIILLVKIMLCYLEALFRLIVPRPMKSLRGQVILITGAGGGIGREMAVRFGRLGARLALWDVDSASCSETTELVKPAGATAYAFTCDVSSVDSVHSAAEGTREKMGDVDIVINNAGISPAKPFLKLSESDIQRTMDINVVAHYWVIQEFLQPMLDKNAGHIVTIASMAGQTGVPYLTEYCASKWGAMGLSEALCEELRRMRKDIQVTVVSPMFTDTAMVRGAQQRLNIRNRFGRMLNVEEVADAIVDGVRRNKHYVQVPGHMGGVFLLTQLLPKRAVHYFTDFIDATVDEIIT